jgi:TRAP-type mannitol/chloroaromatic compound transport system permease small subunit
MRFHERIKTAFGASMNILFAYVKAIDWLNERLGKLSAFFIMASCLIAAGNAVVRLLIPTFSSNAFIEIQWYLFGAAVMLTASWVLMVNEHVRVDVMYGRFENRGKVILDIIGMVFFLLSMSVLCMWLSWPFFLDKFNSGEMSQNAGGLIRWPVALMLPLGFALLSLQGISEIIKRVGWLNGSYNMDVHYEKPLQ